MNFEIIKDVKLKSGSHKSLEEGACVMELVSYVAGEAWTDHPKCSCPVLTRMAIRINDRVDDETRQKLKDIIPLIVGTRGTRQDEIARARFIAHRVCTVTLPVLADTLELKDVAERLRAFGPNELIAIADYCREQKEAFREAGRKHAAAYAYAAYAYAAAAYAYAAYADAADAYAADAYAAYAYAADAADAADARWSDIRQQINDSSIETLGLACSVWAEK